MGATTVVATTSEVAPGYCPCTLMIGGAISGYWATGRRANDTTPRITNTIETTEAKIGRSMKKCEIFIARGPVGWAKAPYAVVRLSTPQFAPLPTLRRCGHSCGGQRRRAPRSA